MSASLDPSPPPEGSPRSEPRPPSGRDPRPEGGDDLPRPGGPDEPPREGWLLPASSAFAVASVAALAGVWAGPGCQTACQGDFDCTGVGYCDQSTGRCVRDCFTNDDCRNPPECRDNPTACRPLGQFCSGTGRCLGPLVPDLPGSVVSTPQTGGPRSLEGFDDPPGVGYAFIVEQIALAGRDRGFDLDGQCDEDGCIDNVLWPLADLANDQIRQGLLGGESLLLIELAGLDDDPYTGYDDSLTVKVYGAEDADEPFFPANNFSTPDGHDTCCEFKINGESLQSPPPQARARAPAELDRGQLRSLAPVPIRFTLTVGAEPHPVVRLERVLLSGRLARNFTAIEEGLLGGAVPITTLFSTENPYCKTNDSRCQQREFTGESTLLDLVTFLLGPEPDIDLDFDGVECLYDTDGDALVDKCCDGGGPGISCDTVNQTCEGREIERADPDDPSSCARPAAIDDGYSLAIAFEAVRAKIVGSSN